jgi:peroxiredoxin (alkyl hydroperoxide reductase subunit C)
MKKSLTVLLILCLSAFIVDAQNMDKSSGEGLEEKNYEIPLIGDTAPSFSAMTTKGTLHFPEDFGKKWKVLLSHPLDYTPVCSSELLELAYAQDEFKELGVKLVVVSTDKLERHEKWKESMETLNYKNREAVEIKFPLVDDHSKSVANKYGMLHPNASTTKDVRGVFIIDPNNIVRAISFHPMEVGRNIEDIKRTIIALQTVESEVVNTPANWQPGDDVLIPYTKGEQRDDAKVAYKNDPDIYEVAWYMVFKKSDKTLAEENK